MDSEVHASSSHTSSVLIDACGCWLQGDDYVDWVGCSIYHFGTSFPYGANVNPLPRTFTSTVCKPHLSEKYSSHAVLCSWPSSQLCRRHASFQSVPGHR